MAHTTFELGVFATGLCRYRFYTCFNIMVFKDFNAKLEMGDSYGGRPKKVRQSFLSNPAAVVKEMLANSR